MIHRVPRIVQQWLRALVARDRAERDLDDELRFFVEERQRRMMEEGLTSGEALRRARLEAGGIEQVKEAVRDSWRARMLDESAHDIRSGARALRRSPAFSVVALLTLALGIGATMIVRESLRPVAAGMAIGLVAAFVLTPWLEAVLFGVTPTDLPTFAAAATIFAAAATMASLLPALRAARINPMQALRVD